MLFRSYVSEDSKSTLDMIRQMLDDAMYKYLAVLLAQPFDVAKTVLQVRNQGLLEEAGGRKKGVEGFGEMGHADVSWAIGEVITS